MIIRLIILACMIPLTGMGQAMGFNGSSSRIRTSVNPFSIGSGTDARITIVMILKINALPVNNTFGVAACKYESNSTGFDFRFYNESNVMKLQFIGDGGTGVSVNYSPATNTWMSIAARYNGNTSKTADILVNGAILATGTLAYVTSNSKLLSIGAFGSYGGTAELGRYFNGVIGYVAIYTRVLTDAECALATIVGLQSLIRINPSGLITAYGSQPVQTGSAMPSISDVSGGENTISPANITSSASIIGNRRTK